VQAHLSQLQSPPTQHAAWAAHFFELQHEGFFAAAAWLQQSAHLQSSHAQTPPSQHPPAAQHASSQPQLPDLQPPALVGVAAVSVENINAIRPNKDKIAVLRNMSNSSVWKNGFLQPDNRRHADRRIFPAEVRTIRCDRKRPAVLKPCRQIRRLPIARITRNQQTDRAP